MEAELNNNTIGSKFELRKKGKYLNCPNKEIVLKFVEIIKQEELLLC